MDSATTPSLFGELTPSERFWLYADRLLPSCDVTGEERSTVLTLTDVDVGRPLPEMILTALSALVDAGDVSAALVEERRFLRRPRQVLELSRVGVARRWRKGSPELTLLNWLDGTRERRGRVTDFLLHEVMTKEARDPLAPALARVTTGIRDLLTIETVRFDYVVVERRTYEWREPLRTSLAEVDDRYVMPDLTRHRELSPEISVAFRTAWREVRALRIPSPDLY